MSASWYLAGPDGLRFNWNKAPTFQCPNADAVTYTAAEDGGEGTWTLQRTEVAAAASAIGADPVMLGKLLRQRHASFAAGRLRVDGRLTDRCAICGAKMGAQGLPRLDRRTGADESSQRVARRLGLEGPRTTVRTTWHPTKAEAQAWARHETQARPGARREPAHVTLDGQLSLMLGANLRGANLRGADVRGCARPGSRTVGRASAPRQASG